MIQAFFLSLGQLFDRPILAVFLQSVLLTPGLLFVAASIGLWFGMHALADGSQPGWGLEQFGPAADISTCW